MTILMVVMKTISDLLTSIRKILGEANASLFLPINPVPASRPRVTRWGTYYPKTYKNWKKEAAWWLKDLKVENTLEGELITVVESVVRKPKTTKRSNPRGDVDNYAKAALDAINDTEVWLDDDQVVMLIATKQFTTDEEKVGVNITVYEVE